MARPRRDQNEPTALDRLEHAYWELLENTSQKPTVAAIAKAAQVNHNTFYYYFNSVEDMAEKMFQRNISNELVTSMIPIILGNHITEESFLAIPNAQEKAHRMRLMASSPLTAEKLRSFIIDMWMRGLGLDLSKFEEADRTKILFLSHGAVGVLRSTSSDNVIPALSQLYLSPMGKGIIQTVEELREKYCDKPQSAS